MVTTGSGPKSNTLAQAASVVFALVAVIPLLLFAYSLHSLDALGTARYQIALTVALAVSLFGFYIFRSMVGRMSALIRSAPRPAPPKAAAPSPAAPAGGPGPAWGPAPDALRVPGIGLVQELGEMNELLNQMWRTEAWPHLGQRVLLSLRDAPQPAAGTLVEITPQGFVLAVEGQQVAISYRRVSAIEPERTAPPRG